MQSETAKIRLLTLVLMNLLFVLLSGNASAQQSIEDNIRPVGQVCLAGQSCVGNPVGKAAVAMPAAEFHGEAIAEPITEEIAVTEVAVEVEAAVEPAVAAFDVEATYQMSCFACHGTGAAGAPKLGDQVVWEERMAKGIDAVMANVVTGVNTMPPKGLCMTCSDGDLRALVDYMTSQ